MLHEGVVPRKHLVADLASKIAHAGMAARVAHQIGALEEPIVAVVALVLLHPRVPVLVGLEVGPATETPAAQVAHVHPLLAVHVHVPFQRGGCRKGKRISFFFLLFFGIFWYFFFVASAAHQRPTCSYHANKELTLSLQVGEMPDSNLGLHVLQSGALPLSQHVPPNIRISIRLVLKGTSGDFQGEACRRGVDQQWQWGKYRIKLSTDSLASSECIILHGVVTPR